MGNPVKNPLITIENYTFSIGALRILDSVSFSVYEDEYLSVIGPNGAGKTTLLKCLMRIYTGGTGTITLRGKSLERYSQRELARVMSYVPQGNGSGLSFTVEEFVLMGRYPHLSPFTSFSGKDREAVRNALVLTGTANLAGRGLNTLSGGERQTVYIAAALAQSTRILLLDEPTTFLDPKHETDIYTILDTIKREFGTTIITVTHDINNAALRSDRIVIVKNGTVVFCGKAEEIMTNEILEHIYERPFTFVCHPVTGQRIVVPEVQKP
ncbi:ABC transporter ATP-binding protein [bacterium]|nr:ABC transporter ATP-binding protein [bacterium]